MEERRRHPLRQASGGHNNSTSTKSNNTTNSTTQQPAAQSVNTSGPTGSAMLRRPRGSDSDDPPSTRTDTNSAVTTNIGVDASADLLGNPQNTIRATEYALAVDGGGGGSANDDSDAEPVVVRLIDTTTDEEGEKETEWGDRERNNDTSLNETSQARGKSLMTRGTDLNGLMNEQRSEMVRKVNQEQRHRVLTMTLGGYDKHDVTVLSSSPSTDEDDPVIAQNPASATNEKGGGEEGERTPDSREDAIARRLRERELERRQRIARKEQQERVMQISLGAYNEVGEDIAVISYPTDAASYRKAGDGGGGGGDIAIKLGAYGYAGDEVFAVRGYRKGAPYAYDDSAALRNAAGAPGGDRDRGGSVRNPSPSRSTTTNPTSSNRLRVQHPAPQHNPTAAAPHIDRKLSLSGTLQQENPAYRKDSIHWNEMLRAALELPSSSLAEKIAKTKRLQLLADQFVATAERFGRLIIEEGKHFLAELRVK